jgi:hypothetical protein
MIAPIMILELYATPDRFEQLQKPVYKAVSPEKPRKGSTGHCSSLVICKCGGRFAELALVRQAWTYWSME